MLGTEMEHDDLPLVASAPLPIVVLDNELTASPLDMVSIHNLDGVWQAVHYLHDQGLSDIGYLRSSVPITNLKCATWLYVRLVESSSTKK